MNKKLIRYIANWIIEEAIEWHDTLNGYKINSMNDWDSESLEEAIKFAIEAYEGGAR